jgi:uncharacterized membrane protein
MSLFTVALTIHVLAGILGLGPVVAMAIASARRPTDASLAEELRVLLRRLSALVSVALLVLLASGGLMDRASGGLFHDTWWFRISVVLLVAMGVMNGLTRRRLRRFDTARAASDLRRVSVLARSMLALVAVVTVLMIDRPW